MRLVPATCCTDWSQGLVPSCVPPFIYLSIILDPQQIRNWKNHIIIAIYTDYFHYSLHLFGTLCQRIYHYVRLIKIVLRNSWECIFFNVPINMHILKLVGAISCLLRITCTCCVQQENSALFSLIINCLLHDQACSVKVGEYWLLFFFA